MKRRRAIACLALGSLAAVAYGCSLGLDPSKIRPKEGDDAGAARAPDDAATTQSTVDAESDARPPGDAASTRTDAEAGATDASGDAADAAPSSCLANTDCASTNACLVGTCDAGTCSYGVCPSATCTGSTCSSATNTCSVPASYGFHATAISVTAGAVGCEGNAASCIAAVYPFVFVGTASGAVAYDVSDPSNPSPRMVPFTGVDFVPLSITSMGSRVYFVGQDAGDGTNYHLQIASLDVPSDPLTPSFTATTAFDAVNASAVSSAWARTDGSLLLVEDVAASFPAALVTAPLIDGASISFFTSASVPAGGTPVAASGTRAVISRWNGALPNETYFSFELGIGTKTATNAGEQGTYGLIGGTAPQGTYAQGPDGSVLWNTASTEVVNDAGTEAIRAVRMAWLVSSGTSPALSPSSFVDVEPYTTPLSLGVRVAGPIAWVNPTTALVLAAAAEEFTTGPAPLTSVQLAVDVPAPTLVAGRRTLLSVDVSQVGAAASGGFGYVLAADPAGATTCTLHIFAPGCSP